MIDTGVENLIPLRDVPRCVPPPPDAGDAVVPEGAPEWVTPALLRETMRVWGPFYGGSMSPETASTILRNVGRLFAVLSRSADHETLRRPGAGIES